MTELVLDASVVLKWFRPRAERDLDAARSLRTAFEAGLLIVLAPTLLRLEIVNVAARRWGWDEETLVELAVALDELGFEFVEPESVRLARWTGRGLTAYDAAYVAVAEATWAQLVTDDDRVVTVAGDLATALAAAGR